MNAADVINGLRRVGIALKDAIAKIQPRCNADYAELLFAVLADPNVSHAVDDFLAAIEVDDVAEAMDEVAAKQAALLQGRDVSRLTRDEYLQYHDLAAARLLLATAVTASAGAVEPSRGPRSQLPLD